MALHAFNGDTHVLHHLLIETKSSFRINIHLEQDHTSIVMQITDIIVAADPLSDRRVSVTEKE